MVYARGADISMSSALSAWDSVVGRTNHRFSWPNTLKSMAFSYYIDLKDAHTYKDSEMSRGLDETRLNRFARAILVLPVLLKEYTNAFPDRDCLTVPYSWPGPAPTDAVFKYRGDDDYDEIPLYQCNIVSYRLHSLTFDIGNRYVEPRRFTFWCGASHPDIDAMFGTGKDLYDLPVPVALATLIDQITPFLQWSFDCMSAVLAKHPTLGLIPSRTRNGSLFHKDE